MYLYQRAVALTGKAFSVWESVNLLRTPVNTIFRDYQQVILVLTNTLDPTERYVDLEQLRAQYALYPNTLEVLLQVLGNRDLDTINKLPYAEKKVAIYTDAYQAGYKIKRTKFGMGVPENYPISEMMDISLARPNLKTNMTRLHTHALLSVNGYYHLTQANEDTAYIQNGMKSCEKATLNHIGILDFGDIGRVEKIPLTPEMIKPASEDLHLKTRVAFSLPEPVPGKTIFLVLGGYLVLPEDGVLWRVSDKDLLLDPSRLPLVERYFESRQSLDVSYLELGDSVSHPDQVNLETFWSDATLMKYFLGPQSFLVTIDTPSLYWTKRPVRSSPAKGSFIAYQRPIFPLYLGYGRGVEYWREQEGSSWAMLTMDSTVRNYLFSGDVVAQPAIVDDRPAFYDPYWISQGALLEIGVF